MIENPYLRKFRQPQVQKKNTKEVMNIIDNLMQRHGNEQEMLVYWKPLIGKTLEQMSKIDRFIVNSEPLIKEPSALHIYLLADATRIGIEEKISYWFLELCKK